MFSFIDDTLFDQSRSQKTELLAKVFGHCSMKFKKGYRLPTLGWSDGNSFVPVDYCLLSVEVILEKDGMALPARVVCVRKKSNRKD